MSTDTMSSFGTQPMSVGQPVGLGIGSQIQGSNMSPLGSPGSMGQMQSFGPSSDYIQSQYGRQPYMYGDPNAGMYSGSQYPIGQSQGIMSRRFGYGMMPGIMGPPMIGPPMIGPPMLGAPVMGPPLGGMYPYGGYEPMMW